MKLPTVDWSVNVSQICSILVFLFTAMGGYYDLKNEVNSNRKVSDERFAQIEKNLVLQNIVDKAQDERVNVSNAEVKSQLRDQASEIKQDIRDLRNDLMRMPKK